MLFKDRRHAGELLAGKLNDYCEKDPLILAVPRGGVIVAGPVRDRLGGELDVVITRKIGAPDQPELAVGAVAADGFVMQNDQLVSRLGVSGEYIRERAKQEQAEVNRRLKDYRGNRPLPAVENRHVILIDDGVATGYTLLAALRSLQDKKPSQLILAVPVGPPDTLEILSSEVDRLVYIEAPPDFAAVSQFYRRFEQVSEQEVKIVLQQAGRD